MVRVRVRLGGNTIIVINSVFGEIGLEWPVSRVRLRT